MKTALAIQKGGGNLHDLNINPSLMTNVEKRDYL